ncbi:hypothetical protein JAAARDRAFT_54971 [Jaapia argillacea MUCL 33604]|uniref:Uncharacterized protein n=1 Tax=Jaapia argillacea MUCL 33604 TaxID=933084 RepID=A0A067Q3Q9_9AGAM|nr:hypothetical protein JAAARDRAFT_54971 [Jaapia argillacea MUCL 33604]
MDTDWCLACNRHTDGTAPYCSRECYSRDHPEVAHALPQSPADSFDEDDDLEFFSFYQDPLPVSHEEYLEDDACVGSETSRILAWAQDIPLGAHPDLDYLVASTSAPIATSSSLRPPALLLQQQRPALPSIYMIPPQLERQEPTISHPIMTPQASLARHNSIHSHHSHHSLGDFSTTATSLVSCEVLTPPSTSASPVEEKPICVSGVPQKSSVFGFIATQVRSWVTTPKCQESAATEFPLPSSHRPAALTVFTTTHPQVYHAPSPLRVPDDDLKISEHWSQTNPYPTPSSHASPQPVRLSPAVARGVKRPLPSSRTQRTADRDHPAFLTRGRKAGRAMS